MKKVATLALVGLALSSCTSNVEQADRIEKRIIGIDSSNVYLISDTTYQCLYDTIVLSINVTKKTYSRDTFYQVVSDSIRENYMSMNSPYIKSFEVSIDSDGTYTD